MWLPRHFTGMTLMKDTEIPLDILISCGGLRLRLHWQRFIEYSSQEARWE